jgi:hypothetical protein
MRRLFTVGLFTLMLCGTAEAGPLRRGSSEGPRFPRVRNAARFVLVPYPYTNPNVPTGSPHRPLVDAAPAFASAASVALRLVESNALNAVGWGVPPTLRAIRVVLFGSPAVGAPRDTLIWIASPSALRVTHWLRERRGIDPTGGEVLWRLRR